jgi:hypothetical protein
MALSSFGKCDINNSLWMFSSWSRHGIKWFGKRDINKCFGGFLLGVGMALSGSVSVILVSAFGGFLLGVGMALSGSVSVILTCALDVFFLESAWH